MAEKEDRRMAMQCLVIIVLLAFIESLTALSLCSRVWSGCSAPQGQSVGFRERILLGFLMGSMSVSGIFKGTGMSLSQ